MITNMISGQHQERPNQKLKYQARYKGDANHHMPHCTALLGHLTRRDDNNVSEEITTLKVGGSRPRSSPALRWMDSAK